MTRRGHLDLFSGIGGFSLAAEACGFQTVAFSEIDPDASRVLAHHWPEVPNLGDIRKLCRRAFDCIQNHEDDTCHCPRCDAEFGECACIGTDEFTDTHGFPDLITGGVPCQPASALGQMRGTADERWLWPEATRIMCELRPRFGLFENPPALLTLEGGRAWNGIVSGVVALGYDCWWDVFPAAAFGAGHLRERVLLVCADRARGCQRQQPEHGLCAGRDFAWREDSREVSSDATRLDVRGAADEGNTTAEGGDARCIIAGDRVVGLAPDADGSRLQGHAGDGADGERAGVRPEARRHAAPADLRGRVAGADWWHEAHTGVPVLADGLSARLVEAAARCSGNAVVPQVLMPILEALASL